MTAVPLTGITIKCPRCRRPIEVAHIKTSAQADCPLCANSFEAVRFDPPERVAAKPQMVGTTMVESQPCATHPLNAAVTSCERCGTFMCSLCRIDLDGRTLCPTCFERLSSEGALESTRTTFRDYNGMASVTALFGCLLMILGILFGPLAIYYGVKGLKQKKAMGESDGLTGLWLAIVVGVVEAGVGVFFVFTFVKGMLR